MAQYLPPTFTQNFSKLSLNLNVYESTILFLLKEPIFNSYGGIIPFIMLALQNAITRSTWTTKNTAFFRFKLIRCITDTLMNEPSDFSYVGSILSHVGKEEKRAIFYVIFNLASNLKWSTVDRYIGHYVGIATTQKLKHGPWTLLQTIRKGFQRLFGTTPDVGPPIFLAEVIIWVEAKNLHLQHDVPTTAKIIMLLLGAVYGLRPCEFIGKQKKLLKVSNLLLNTPVTFNWLSPNFERELLSHVAPAHVLSESIVPTLVEQGTIVLYHTKTDFKNQNVGIYFKGGQKWLCLITAVKQHLWVRHCQGESITMDSPLIVCDYKGNQPMAANQTTYNTLVDELANDIGKPNAKPYALRRGCASQLMRLGGVTGLEKDIFLRHNIFSLASYLKIDPNWMHHLQDKVIAAGIKEAISMTYSSQST